MHLTTSEPALIGLLSDTHNLLRPSVVKLLKNCNVIIHAGDIGNFEILYKLEKIAPVIAVRGNTDRDLCFDKLPTNRMITLFGISFYIIHDLDNIDLNPATVGIKVVVSGHTHKPKSFEHDRVKYINPGSSGYRRADCPIALAFMSIKKKL